MLETVKMQKTIRADKETIWTEVLKADFASGFLPEIKSSNDDAMPTYSVPGKLLSWYNMGQTSIKMANKDLQAHIESIEFEIVPIGNKIMVKFEVNLKNKFDLASIKRYRAIEALFNTKLMVLKEELEQNQVNWSPAFS